MTRRSEADAGTLLATLLAIPALALFNGWVLKTAWNWFVPPVTGWTQLGVLQAVGIAVVIQIAMPRRYRTHEEREQDGGELWAEIALHAGAMLLGLGIGWVVHTVIA
jgi:hypothetical protein